MNRFLVLIGLVLILTGCNNKMNEFEYADATEQDKVSLLEMCNYPTDGYCKALKDGSIVYFDTIFINESIVAVAESKYEDVNLPVERDICQYAKQKLSEDSKEYITFFATEFTNYMFKEMRKNGLDGKAIYVVKDINDDLILRSTNGKIEYNYFDSNEFNDNDAEKMYNDCISIGL